MERQYSDKYVAFIDILGFKAILDKEGEDASRISRLFDTIVKCKEEILKKIRYTHKRNPIRSIKEAYAKEKDDADLFQCYDAALDDMVIKVVSDSTTLGRRTGPMYLAAAKGSFSAGIGIGTGWAISRGKRIKTK